jgi:hypothetical protein
MEKQIGLNAVKAIHLYSITLKNEEDIDHRSLFGHLMAVRFMETTKIGIVSKYSNPTTQLKVIDLKPKTPIRTLEDAERVNHVVLSRIKHAQSSMYSHSTGYVWKNKITAVIHKKGHINLHQIINESAYTPLSLFQHYNIFDEFPGAFERREPDKHNFKHSISVTCSADLVVDTTLNSPCKKLSGVRFDHTINSL